MKLSPVFAITVTSAAMLATAPAMAHTGSETAAGLIAGFAHPFTGLDHLLAMLAVGIWAAQQKGRLQLSITATFIALLLTGFISAVNGFVMPLMEGTIATSLLVSGLLICCAARLPAQISLALTAVFALAHGQAHGIEVVGISAVLFAAGFIAGSALLQFFGAVSAQALQPRMPLILKTFGGITALMGTALLLTA
ncbi:HupE/UreJ family protein [Amphritea sp. HPY]|uniref:HupE/UreJ family protein n=1 Tax=Amphritea sp. HPY TaxID=3421652 RepID=UPI003D7EB94E